MIEKRSVPTLDGGYVGEREERVRLLRADADLREMELAKERGLMVALPDVESALTDLVLTTKARIMAIPSRIAPELVGETSRVMIQAKFRTRLQRIARVFSQGRQERRHASRFAGRTRTGASGSRGSRRAALSPPP